MEKRNDKLIAIRINRLTEAGFLGLPQTEANKAILTNSI